MTIIKNKNNNTQKQTGGELLSEGGFGCVFHPMINCKGRETNNEKYVTKIQLHDESAKNEIKISKKIKRMSQYKLFFSPIIDSCPIKKTELDQGVIEECNILQKDKMNIMLMKMPYAGQYSFFDYILSIQRQEKKIMNVIISSYPYLLHALERLVDNDIIHFDVKGNNIMFYTKKNIPLIIDFGLSIDFNNISKENYSFYFYTYAPDYYIWSPEIHFINYLINVDSKLTKKNIKQICQEITKENKILHSLYSKKNIQQHTETMVQFFSRFIDKDISSVIEELIQYRNTWDQYSLSLLFLKITHILTLNGEKTDNRFIQRFSQLLFKNIHPNPEKRPYIQESIQSFQDMITLSTKFEDDFQSILKSLNKTKQERKKEITKYMNEMTKLTDSIKATQGNKIE